MELRDMLRFSEIENAINRCIQVYDVKADRKKIHYFGIPKVTKKEAFEILRYSIPEDYNFVIQEFHGDLIITIFPDKRNLRINLILAILTFLSTTFVGTFMFNANPMENPALLMRGLPFSISIMFVLGAHEIAHYFSAKRNGIKASLPYFIPFPSLIGTMGAIIIHRGMLPNKKALFDLGVSGPLTGLLASILVTFIGLSLPFEVPEGVEGGIILGVPPLFYLISIFASFQGNYIHPVAFAGWVGMLVTFLNMLPVGQLDGGHVLRAMISKRSFEKISSIVSNFVLILGIVLLLINKNGSLWIVWGILLLFFSRGGHPDPVDDEVELDLKRKIIGILAFFLAFLCFTPVPFETNI
jgi:membrane-associated protease RseP (regulator of RpoE activity)